MARLARTRTRTRDARVESVELSAGVFPRCGGRGITERGGGGGGRNPREDIKAPCSVLPIALTRRAG